MPNSPQIPFLAHNSTVKAWCWTGVTITQSTSSPTQATVDAVSFIDGYNLRLDAVTHTNALPSIYANENGNVYNANTNASGVAVGPYGALRFSFITPMRDTKYKVFVQFCTPDPYIPYAHALNSSIYPKTTTGFWVRAGLPVTSPGSSTNQMTNVTLFNGSNMRVVVL